MVTEKIAEGTPGLLSSEMLTMFNLAVTRIVSFETEMSMLMTGELREKCVL